MQEQQKQETKITITVIIHKKNIVNYTYVLHCFQLKCKLFFFVISEGLKVTQPTPDALKNAKTYGLQFQNRIYLFLLDRQSNNPQESKLENCSSMKDENSEV
jgi:K+ transporter